MDVNSFFATLMVALLGPPLAGLVFYRKFFWGTKGRGRIIRFPYGVTEIPSEFRGKDFIDRAMGELCGISGKAGSLIIFNDETVEAFRGAHSRGVKINFIRNPIQSCPDNENETRLLKLAEEGVINLFYLDNDPAERFWVSENGQVLYEDVFESPVKERVACYFPENAFEAAFCKKKFKKALKNKDIARYGVN